jgi:glutamate decarboxylase
MWMLTNRADLHDIPYASRYDVQMDLPKYKMPENGVESKVVYQLLHDELELGQYSLWMKGTC